MPIQIVTAYRVGELVLPTIQEAQKRELIDLMAADPTSNWSDLAAAAFIVAHTNEIVAILTCQPKSKSPRAPRSDKGKKRGPKTLAPEQT